MAYRMGVTQVREREINAKKGVNFRSRIGERRTGRGQRAGLEEEEDAWGAVKMPQRLDEVTVSWVWAF